MSHGVHVPVQLRIACAAMMVLCGTACSNRDAVQADLRFDRAELEQREVQGMTAASLPGTGSNWEVGAPSLPITTCHLVLPQGMMVKAVRIARYETERIEGEFDIWPVQAPAALPGTPELTPPDPEYYGLPLYPEEVAWFARQGLMSGYNIAAVFVAPVQYAAAEKKLLFHSRVRFSLELETGEPDSAPSPDRSPEERESIEKNLAKIVSNPGDLVRFAPGQ